MTESINLSLATTAKHPEWTSVQAMLGASSDGDVVYVRLSHHFGLAVDMYLSPESAYELAQALMDARLAANEIAEKRASEVAA